MQLTSATDSKGGRVHLVAETGHVGAFFGDPKVAHGHIVYTAPHVHRAYASKSCSEPIAIQLAAES